jgi:hypothetical protein
MRLMVTERPSYPHLYRETVDGGLLACVLHLPDGAAITITEEQCRKLFDLGYQLYENATERDYGSRVAKYHVCGEEDPGD